MPSLEQYCRSTAIQNTGVMHRARPIRKHMQYSIDGIEYNLHISTVISLTVTKQIFLFWCHNSHACSINTNDKKFAMLKKSALFASVTMVGKLMQCLMMLMFTRASLLHSCILPLARYRTVMITFIYRVRGLFLCATRKGLPYKISDQQNTFLVKLVSLDKLSITKLVQYVSSSHNKGILLPWCRHIYAFLSVRSGAKTG